MPLIPPVLVTVHDLQIRQGRLLPAGTVQMINQGRLSPERLEPMIAPEPVDPQSFAARVLNVLALCFMVVPAAAVLKEGVAAWLYGTPMFRNDLTMVLMFGGILVAGALVVSSTLALASAGVRAYNCWADNVLDGWRRNDRHLLTPDDDSYQLAVRLQDCATALNAVGLSGPEAVDAREAHDKAMEKLGTYIGAKSVGPARDRGESERDALAEVHAAITNVEVLATRNSTSPPALRAEALLQEPA